MEIVARNVTSALAQALSKISMHGKEESSRNGTVLVFDEPVMTTYSHPQERVLFCPVRNANPFFHLMESLWMLTGRRDIGFLVQFNRRMKEYSDDGKTQAGAYGFRWRKYFGFDQLEVAIKELRRDPNTRRVVVQMWSANDLGGTGKDLPCNTQIYFDCRTGRLNMTVCNRSNDILWGAYGANAVHFSVLLEYMSFAVGLPVGVYRQFSNNLHLYTDILPITGIDKMIASLRVSNHYINRRVSESQLISTDFETWNVDLRRFFICPDSVFKDMFFSTVVSPMYRAWRTRENYNLAVEHAMSISATDWRLACVEWLTRRAERRTAK